MFKNKKENNPESTQLFRVSNDLSPIFFDVHLNHNAHISVHQYVVYMLMVLVLFCAKHAIKLCEARAFNDQHNDPLSSCQLRPSHIDVCDDSPSNIMSPHTMYYTIRIFIRLSVLKPQRRWFTKQESNRITASSLTWKELKGVGGGFGENTIVGLPDVLF